MAVTRRTSRALPDCNDRIEVCWAVQRLELPQAMAVSSTVERLERPQAMAVSSTKRIKREPSTNCTALKKLSDDISAAETPARAAKVVVDGIQPQEEAKLSDGISAAAPAARAAKVAADDIQPQLDTKISDDISATNTSAPEDAVDVIELKEDPNFEDVWWGAKVYEIEVVTNEPYLAKGCIVYDNFRNYDAASYDVIFFSNFELQQVRYRKNNNNKKKKNKRNNKRNEEEPAQVPVPISEILRWKHCSPPRPPAREDDPNWALSTGVQAVEAIHPERILAIEDLREKTAVVLNNSKEADIRLARLEKTILLHGSLLSAIPPARDDDDDKSLKRIVDRVKGLLATKLAAQGGTAPKTKTGDGDVQDIIGDLSRRTTTIDVDCTLHEFELLCRKIRLLLPETKHDVLFKPDYHETQHPAADSKLFLILFSSFVDLLKAFDITNPSDIFLMLFRLFRKNVKVTPTVKQEPKEKLPGGPAAEPAPKVIYRDALIGLRITGTFSRNLEDVKFPTHAFLGASYPVGDTAPKAPLKRAPICAIRRMSREKELTQGKHVHGLETMQVSPPNLVLLSGLDSAKLRLEAFYISWKVMPKVPHHYSCNIASTTDNVHGTLRINCPYLHFAKDTPTLAEYAGILTADYVLKVIDLLTN